MPKTKYCGIYLDEQSNTRLKQIQDANGLSKSAAIRLIIAETARRQDFNERKQPE